MWRVDSHPPHLRLLPDAPPTLLALLLALPPTPSLRDGTTNPISPLCGNPVAASIAVNEVIATLNAALLPPASAVGAEVTGLGVALSLGLPLQRFLCLLAPRYRLMLRLIFESLLLLQIPLRHLCPAPAFLPAPLYPPVPHWQILLVRALLTLVTIRGALEAEADVAGFLASCFRDVSSHRRYWRQRSLPDGRLLITTAPDPSSYFKRSLIRRRTFQWGDASLSVDDWVEDEVYDHMPMMELSVGLALRDLPIIFWNEEALSALVCSFGAFDALDTRSLRWADLDACHIRIRAPSLNVIPRRIFASVEGRRYSVHLDISWHRWILHDSVSSPPDFDVGAHDSDDDLDADDHSS
ncbi:hypothetical protein Cni_G06270 [Canna indica]|uniref:DUF4283 domain-containing protein n=1 Tax=Canna indica TaxID=4628 RepID=A0AAQ3JZ35_9LILI|nr:hypothetical protein Cni_G06270 [Canna indica]